MCVFVLRMSVLAKWYSSSIIIMIFFIFFSLFCFDAILYFRMDFTQCDVACMPRWIMMRIVLFILSICSVVYIFFFRLRVSLALVVFQTDIIALTNDQHHTFIIRRVRIESQISWTHWVREIYGYDALGADKHIPFLPCIFYRL